MTLISLQRSVSQDNGDVKDITIQKLQKKIQDMDQEHASYRRAVASLEQRVDELNTLKEAYESKIEAFESLFRMMNEDAQLQRASIAGTEASFSSTDSDNLDAYYKRLEI